MQASYYIVLQPHSFVQKTPKETHVHFCMLFQCVVDFKVDFKLFLLPPKLLFSTEIETILHNFECYLNLLCET